MLFLVVSMVFIVFFFEGGGVVSMATTTLLLCFRLIVVGAVITGTGDDCDLVAVVLYTILSVLLRVAIAADVTLIRASLGSGNKYRHGNEKKIYDNE